MRRARLEVLVSGLAVAGCTTGQVGTLPAQHSLGAAQFSLKLAVGTATIANVNGTTQLGLNVVATFRQPSGQNATLANTPTLSGPASFNGASSIAGVTPNQVAAAATIGSGVAPPGAFGSLIGVFGYGLAPLNLVDGAENQAAYAGDLCDGVVEGGGSDAIRYDALSLPLSLTIPCFTTTGLPYNEMQYYGGPPAWPSPQGYGIPDVPGAATFIGYPFGFTDFYDVAPVAGTYKLGVSYPTSPTGSAYATLNTSAPLNSGAGLPYFPPPAIQIQPDGSAFVSVDVPAGATEAIVSISATACFKDALGNELPVREFSLLTRQTGPQTLFLSSQLGPPGSNGQPTDTFCTANDDQQPNHSNGHIYSLGAIAFNYPAYEASYPQSNAPKPVIAGTNGQADISTASPQLEIGYSLAPPP